MISIFKLDGEESKAIFALEFNETPYLFLYFNQEWVNETDPEVKAIKEELNPKIYGVIVSKGQNRGLLLPDLEGVDTVEEQLNIACQKGGINPNSDYNIEKFEVIRYKEGENNEI